MPVYLYRCPEHGRFEQWASHEDGVVPCPCGLLAERLPCSGIPYLRGETVAKSIPDMSYRQETEKRELRASGWDYDRAVRHIRKGIVEDKEGRKSFDVKQADTA